MENVKILLKSLFCLGIYIFQGAGSFAQDTIQQKKLSISLEIRPRAEYRSNYSTVINDSVQSELYASQRNRLCVSYAKKDFLFHTSLQEIHLWGKRGKPSSIGGINAFELYVQKKILSNLMVKIGRQGVLLDNGRIFSDAPWAQQSRSHEGLRLTYNNAQLSTDLFTLATRKYKPWLDKNISPVAEHRYKWLLIHHLNYRPTEALTVTTINAVDFFKTQKSYQRFTSGGRIEWEQDMLYLTVSGYYQYGKASANKKLNAYYLQPELKLSYEPVILRLGAEVLSGDRTLSGYQSNNFDVLYGVAWKFMGNMNFFTKFPADVNNKGLVNPYLFALFPLGKKVAIRSDYHLFYTQHPLVNDQGLNENKYLGFENDLSMRLTPIKNLEINQGFSYFIAQKQMEYLKKLTHHKRVPIWAYLMISYTFKY